jgi:ADP-ribosylglycohydrolase
MEKRGGERLKRAFCSLEGLSVGDAIGWNYEFSSRHTIDRAIETGILPSPPWRYSDDTNMAISIVTILRQCGEIDQDQLTTDFAARYDRSRSYGPGTIRLLKRIREGEDWREASPQQFGGQGSFGNGAPMRVAPLGAYFSDEVDVVVEQANLSVEVTHAHPEARAGAIAVAVAAAYARQLRDERDIPERPAFIDLVLQLVPESEVRDGVTRARDLPIGTPIPQVVAALGNGSSVSSQDTVPFVLWCAGEHLSHFEQALWTAISAGGDVDTTSAMVGGIVAMYTGVEGIPEAWRRNREPLPIQFS